MTGLLMYTLMQKAIETYKEGWRVENGSGDFFNNEPRITVRRQGDILASECPEIAIFLLCIELYEQELKEK